MSGRSRTAGPAWLTFVSRAPMLLAVIAGLLLVAMVCVITLGVVSRYVFSAPLLGVNEIVQLIAVALAMLALPHATAAGAHVRVDLFDRPLGRWGRLAGDILARGLSIVALWFLCRQAWVKALDAAEYGDVTNMLQLPLWPAYGAVLLGMGLSAVIMAVQIVVRVIGWRHDHV